MTETIRVYRTPVIAVANRNGYRIGLEDIAMHTFIHVDVSVKWTRALKAAIRRDIDAVLEMHGGPLYGTTHVPHKGDPQKFAKFAALMGFTFDAMVPCDDGVERPVYSRRKQPCPFSEARYPP